MSNKYKAEMDASQAGRRQVLARLNLPIPGLELVPEWLAVLVCGLFICAVGSFMAQINLRAVEQMRLFWSLGEIGLGVLVMLVAQVRAFLEIVPRGLRRKKLLMFVRYDLWWFVWQRMPDTSWSIWLLGWGAGLSVCGLLILIALAVGL
jgi:hypothetical protein